MAHPKKDGHQEVVKTHDFGAGEAFKKATLPKSVREAYDRESGAKVKGGGH